MLFRRWLQMKKVELVLNEHGVRSRGVYEAQQ